MKIGKKLKMNWYLNMANISTALTQKLKESVIWVSLTKNSQKRYNKVLPLVKLRNSKKIMPQTTMSLLNPSLRNCLER